MMDMGRVLIADDEATFLCSTADLLRREGFYVSCAADAAAAAEGLRTESFDVLITDIQMPGNGNLEFVHEVSRLAEGMPVILVTGYPSVRTAVDSIRLPVTAYLVKPFDFRDLLTDVRRAIACKQVDMQLRTSRDELRKLSAQLELAREEERTRIAREIHDELGQVLTAIKMDLARVARHLSANRKIVRKEIDLMIVSADSAIQTVRKVATQLRLSVLDHFGLIAAIESQLEQFQRRHGNECKVSARLEEVNLDANRSTTLFRILQEALTNVMRHARASQLDVTLEREGANGVVLRVRDNGIGIEPGKLLGSTSLVS